jgi:hypothetical protein
VLTLSTPEIYRSDLQAFVPQLLAHSFASKRVLQALHGREGPRSGTAGQRRFPSSERFVPCLRIVMPQPVHLTQTGHLALPSAVC